MKIFLILLTLFGNITHATDPRPANTDITSWISQLGPVTVTAGGTTLLPQNVLQSQMRGQVSSPLQFVMQNHLMNKCIEKAIATPPARRMPYRSAKAQFEKGVCILSKCFQSQLLMMVLPSLKVGAEDASTRQITATMLGAFSTGPSCDGSSDKGIDPLLIALITQSR